jgi:hypothetical protein
VPRTDYDLSFTHPGWLPSGFRAGFYRAANRTLTQWTVLMKTVTGKRIIMPSDVENSNFAPTHLKDPVSPFRQAGNWGNHIFGRHYAFSFRFKKREAFPPRMFRWISNDTGICSTLLGWSKS